MEKELFLKRRIIIAKMSQEFFMMNAGDKMPLIVDLEKKYQTSRGTIQNAINHLKDEDCIQIKTFGKNGSIISSINHKKLQNYFFNKSFMGILPLPYSTNYISIATGLYKSFENHPLTVTLTYNRGSISRFKMLDQGIFSFAVSSKGAALNAISEGYNIQIAKELGANSYAIEHVLVFKKGSPSTLFNGARVAIDRNSYDQRKLTEEFIKDKEVQLVEIGLNRFFYALSNDEVDFGIWDLVSVQSQKGKFDYVEINYAKSLFQEGVIVVNSKDDFAKLIIDKWVDIEYIKGIQKSVRDGDIVSIY